MGPPQCQRRRLARCRWVHTVGSSYRTARRDAPAGRGLERHSEPGVGSAPGRPTWVICDRSRELVADRFMRGLATGNWQLETELETGNWKLETRPDSHALIPHG